MNFKTKFALWFPVCSVLLIAYTLIVQPMKHVWMGIDPIYVFIYSRLPSDIQNLVATLILHFILALIYGLMLDYFIKTWRTNRTETPRSQKFS